MSHTKMLMDLFIETLTGATFELRVSPFETIMSVKAKVNRVEGIPISQQHLIYQNRELSDDSCLRDYNIPDGATLKLVLGMRGGPINTRPVSLVTRNRDGAHTGKTSGGSGSGRSSASVSPTLTSTGKKISGSICSGLGATATGTGGGEEMTSGKSSSQNGRHQVTLLVFREGDEINFVRVYDRGDGTLTPLAEPLSAGSHQGFSGPDGESDTESACAGPSTSKRTLGTTTKDTHKYDVSSSSTASVDNVGVSYSDAQTDQQNNIRLKLKKLQWKMNQLKLNKTKYPSNFRAGQLAPISDLSDSHKTSSSSNVTLGTPRKIREPSGLFNNTGTLTSKTPKPPFMPSSSTYSELPTPPNNSKPDSWETSNSAFNPFKSKPVSSSSHFARLDSTTTRPTTSTINRLQDMASSTVISSDPSASSRFANPSLPSQSYYAPHPPPSQNNFAHNKFSNRTIDTYPHLSFLPRPLATSKPAASDIPAANNASSSIYRMPPSSQHQTSVPTRLLSGRTPVAPISAVDMWSTGPTLTAGTGLTSTTLLPLVDGLQQHKKSPTKRCALCNKKTGLASSYICRCGENFCSRHRYAEAHQCSFDYKSEGRRYLQETNPVVNASKLPKI